MTADAPVLVVRRPINPGEVQEHVVNGRALQTEDTGCVAELPDPIELIAGVTATAYRGSHLDAAMALALHPALRHLPRRLLLDPRLWHWLCLGPLRDFVTYRWAGSAPGETPESIKPSTAERFTGQPSLRGFSRNALARLFFTVDVLEHPDLVNRVFTRQDLFTGVFERRMGLHPTVARACVRTLADCGEAQHRRALLRLNEVLVTTAVELLEQPDADRLVADLVP